ncbi:MFS transporter [Cellulomonas alba]|uniref:MFS transporter n=1 Tax=Cellulomonas alba TaxID=3053467 RepID=A0ABT7SJT4_9CELL|nr:MFS transporter [Cellulomonas alba]MDM7856445.1 MFS transporter [Cellulomonas alba]
MTTPAARRDPSPHPSEGDGRTGFERDRMTIAFYSCFVVWGWLLYSFNPSVPLLAEDLGISDAQAGLHGTAMAVGGIVAAFVTPRLVVRRGRRATLLLACGLVAVGIVALVSAPTLAWSLTAMLALALGGNAMISCAQVGLALRHGRTASAAITEANGVGSSLGLVGPIAVGACVAIGWGWRPAVLVTAALAVTAAVLNRLVPVGGPMTPRAPRRPEHLVAVPPVVPVPMDADAIVAPHEDTPGRHRFGLPSWCFLGGVVAAIAIENATTYWSTNLVREQTGAGAGIATATTAGLVAGMSLIRFVVGPLSLRVPPAALLSGAFGVAIVGWAIVWTAHETWVAIAGLFVAGLGYGAQYPLSIALLLETAPGASDAAQARATLAGGLAIGVAPFLLGALADAVGTHTAFVVVPCFAVLGGLATAFGGVLVHRSHAARLRG